MSAFTLLLPILGVVVGALLQYWLSRTAQERGRLLEVRTRPYTDYLASVSQKTRVSPEKREYSTVLSAIGDAKYRICVYGSGKVIAALADFEATVPTTPEAELRNRFLQLCQAMREDSGSSRPVDLDILYSAVHGFSHEEPSVHYRRDA
jgi:hypothetical protein